MHPDLVINKVKSPEMAGLISFKMTIVKEEDEKLMVKSDVWKRRVQTRPLVFSVRCFIFQCRDLPAADENGSCDPFLKIFDNLAGDDKIRETK